MSDLDSWRVRHWRLSDRECAEKYYEWAELYRYSQVNVDRADGTHHTNWHNSVYDLRNHFFRTHPQRFAQLTTGANADRYMAAVRLGLLEAYFCREMRVAQSPDKPKIYLCHIDDCKDIMQHAHLKGLLPAFSPRIDWVGHCRRKHALQPVENMFFTLENEEPVIPSEPVVATADEGNKDPSRKSSRSSVTTWDSEDEQPGKNHFPEPAAAKDKSALYKVRRPGANGAGDPYRSPTAWQTLSEEEQELQPWEWVYSLHLGQGGYGTASLWILLEKSTGNIIDVSFRNFVKTWTND